MCFNEYEPELQDMLLTGDKPLYLERRPRASEAAWVPPWWPPQKVVAHHLGAYLESAGA